MVKQKYSLSNAKTYCINSSLTQPSCAASQMHLALLRAQAPFSRLPVWQCQASGGKRSFCSRRGAGEASSVVWGSSCCLGELGVEWRPPWWWNCRLAQRSLCCSPPSSHWELSVSPELLPSQGSSRAASLIWNSISALTWDQVDYFSFHSTFTHLAASVWISVDF